jgi:hypothetical protein
MNKNKKKFCNMDIGTIFLHEGKKMKKVSHSTAVKENNVDTYFIRRF